MSRGNGDNSREREPCGKRDNLFHGSPQSRTNAQVCIATRTRQIGPLLRSRLQLVGFASDRCPLWGEDRKSSDGPGMSALCHNRK
jgi:hypothetical protein